MDSMKYMYNDNPVCPYCDHIHQACDLELDFNTFDPEDIEIECNNCERDFRIEIHVDVNYSSEEIIKETCSSCGNERELFKITFYHTDQENQIFEKICVRCVDKERDILYSKGVYVSYRTERLEHE